MFFANLRAEGVADGEGRERRGEERNVGRDPLSSLAVARASTCTAMLPLRYGILHSASASTSA